MWRSKQVKASTPSTAVHHSVTLDVRSRLVSRVDIKSSSIVQVSDGGALHGYSGAGSVYGRVLSSIGGWLARDDMGVGEGGCWLSHDMGTWPRVAAIVHIFN